VINESREILFYFSSEENKICSPQESGSRPGRLKESERKFKFLLK